MGFGVNDHAIRELMRFIEMISRNLYSRMLHEMEESPIINVDGFKLKRGLRFFYILNLSIGKAVL